MKILAINVPDALALDAKEAAMLLATQLYGQGKLSLGQAAEMTGYSKRTFMELLGSYGVAVVDLSEDELLSDAQNAARYHR